VAPTTTEKADNDDGDNEEKSRGRGSMVASNVDKPLLNLWKEPKHHVTYLRTARKVRIKIIDTIGRDSSQGTSSS
jgi:hypothetical protein